MTPDVLALGVLWYLVFVLSLTCHEASHALVAKLGGDETALRAGQVTLNPLPHMRREPFGTIAVPVISYFLSGFMIGWASTPYDPRWEDRHPRRAGLMALAGPGANLALTLVAAALIRGGLAAGVLEAPSRAGLTSIVAATGGGAMTGVAAFLSILFTLNLLLAVFNLLPMPPLDGGTAVGLLLPEDTARRTFAFMRKPAFALIGILVAWQLVSQVFDPVFLLALNLLYPGAGFQ